MNSIFHKLKTQPGFVMTVNFLILIVVYMINRWVFYYMNAQHFQDVTMSDMFAMSCGGLRFDISALCYLNLLCIALQFIPLKARHTVKYQRMSKSHSWSSTSWALWSMPPT